MIDKRAFQAALTLISEFNKDPNRKLKLTGEVDENKGCLFDDAEIVFTDEYLTVNNIDRTESFLLEFSKWLKDNSKSHTPPMVAEETSTTATPTILKSSPEFKRLPEQSAAVVESTKADAAHKTSAKDTSIETSDAESENTSAPQGNVEKASNFPRMPETHSGPATVNNLKNDEELKPQPTPEALFSSENAPDAENKEAPPVPNKSIETQAGETSNIPVPRDTAEGENDTNRQHTTKDTAVGGNASEAGNSHTDQQIVGTNKPPQQKVTENCPDKEGSSSNNEETIKKSIPGAVAGAAIRDHKRFFSLI